ncbi:MAG: class I SAM-dependent methyltransferase, partial [Pseudomonadota bacterium]|nr:class I SAM-dependent methyltransferase [Pseudomonadota bacterium]
GLRNVTNIDAALQEAYRVIKPGGKFLCLEFGKVDSELLGKLYSIYSKKFIPTLGKLVTGNKDAYEYLINSINEFPHQTTLFKKIKKCGFKKGNFINLSSGIVVLYYAWKI